MSIRGLATAFLLFFTVLFLMLGFAAGKAYGHGGRTNQYGFHMSSITGSFHCHPSPLCDFDLTSFNGIDPELGIAELSRNNQVCRVVFTLNDQGLLDFSEIESCRVKDGMDVFRRLYSQSSPNLAPQVDGWERFQALMFNETESP